MKIIVTLTIAMVALSSYGQHMSVSDWEEQSKTNIRLLPMYGHQPKTEEQKLIDAEFISSTMSLEQFKGDRRAASDHMIGLGFKYLGRDDGKTAMYRFNQAFLLDSTNTDIHWGYGGFFMSTGNYAEAAEQYLAGLSIEPKNTHLLTDYGTYFMAQYFGLRPIDEKGALEDLDAAITYLTTSYGYDPIDLNTTYKLSICYWIQGDCTKAWKYYDECTELGGNPITEDFTNDLKTKCARP